MGMRVDAAERVGVLLYQAFIGYLVTSVIAFVGLLWMVVDVIWQLIVGSDGLSSSSRPAMLVSGTLKWSADQTIYALTGGGSGGLKLLPSMA